VRKNNSAAYARQGPSAIAGAGGARVEMAAGNPTPGGDDEQCEWVWGGVCRVRGPHDGPQEWVRGWTGAPRRGGGVGRGCGEAGTREGIPTGTGGQVLRGGGRAALGLPDCPDDGHGDEGQ
jgi:hypothetical protein